MVDKHTNDKLFQLVYKKDYLSLLDLIRSGQIKPDEVITNPDGIKFRLIGVAAEANKLEVVRSLIELRATVNRRSGGQTPLSCAAGLGHIEMVKLLLEAGADVNMTSSSEEGTRETPLMVGTKYPEIVKLLLAAGAEPKSRDGNGHSAMLPASLCGNETVQELLLDAGCPVTSDCLFSPVELRQLRIVQRMLEQKPDVNKPISESYCRFIKGEMPLLVAVRMTTPESLNNASMIPIPPRANRLGIIKALLEAGANVNAKQRSTGRTPLLLAVEEKDAEIAKILIQAGADPTELVVINRGQKVVALELAKKRGLRELISVMQPS